MTTPERAALAFFLLGACGTLACLIHRTLMRHADWATVPPSVHRRALRQERFMPYLTIACVGVLLTGLALWAAPL